MTILIPRKKEFWLRKSTTPQEIHNSSGLLGDTTQFYTFGNNLGVYENSEGLVGSLVSGADFNEDGLIINNAHKALGSADRSIFTGSNLTVVMELTAGPTSPNVWNYPLGTDGNFLRLNLHANGSFTGYIYIADAWRNVIAIQVGGAAGTVKEGDNVFIAMTFDQPTAYAYTALNDEGFLRGTVQNYGAVLDDEGGCFVFGAQATDDVDAFTGTIKNLLITNRTFTTEDLNRYKKNPYQILKQRKTYLPIPLSLSVTATLTGTATASITETDINNGGKTIILTLSNDTWVAVGATFDAERQGIIDGLVSAQSESTGWNAIVQANEPVESVVRTSSTIVTITLEAR